MARQSRATATARVARVARVALMGAATTCLFLYGAVVLCVCFHVIHVAANGDPVAITFVLALYAIATMIPCFIAVADQPDSDAENIGLAATSMLFAMFGTAQALIFWIGGPVWLSHVCFVGTVMTPFAGVTIAHRLDNPPSVSYRVVKAHAA